MKMYWYAEAWTTVHIKDAGVMARRARHNINSVVYVVE